ncbi:integral membrane protein [Dactylonectria macrodidyma]|uniref:Integral membrane protein n=1 Tax=Dactylonectria macrodidyma TaxID=307937 RepID=A0A9P9E2Z6_9HYPO|nr:integral membrane protein [Dactylonectria macrodidyma]
MSTTAFESSIPIENSRQVAAMVVSGLCIFVTCLVVGLRLFAKFKNSKPFDYSDMAIIVALIFNTGLHADMFIMVLRGGFSFHVQDVAMRFGPDALTLFFKCIMVFALLWNATTCFTKLSILLMYVTVFPIRRMMLACRALGIFIILWNIGGVLGGLLVCRPISMNWDQTTPGGKCGNQPMYYMALGIINILVEVTLLGLPFPVLYKLQMPLRKKLVVFGMFSVGFATCGITIYRQATLPGLKFADMTHSGLIATIFSGLEPSVALALSCVPYLRPYFGGTFRSPKNTYNSDGVIRSNKASNNSRPFEELNDDASSEVQLRPIQGRLDTHARLLGLGTSIL